MRPLEKAPPGPASVSPRSTDCIFYLSHGLSGQLAASCACAQPIPYSRVGGRVLENGPPQATQRLSQERRCKRQTVLPAREKRENWRASAPENAEPASPPSCPGGEDFYHHARDRPQRHLFAVRLLLLLTPRRTSRSGTLRGRKTSVGHDIRGGGLGCVPHFLSICPRARSAFGLRLAEVAKSGALGWRSAG